MSGTAQVIETPGCLEQGVSPDSGAVLRATTLPRTEGTAEAGNVQQPALDGIGPPPDGGWQAWACIVGAWCALFCIFGFSEFSEEKAFTQLTVDTSFGQLQVYYLSHQLEDYSESEVG